MSPSIPMINRSKNGPYDNIPTPPVALEPLLPYLKPMSLIWEMCPGAGRLVEILLDQGFRTIAYPERNSFNFMPGFSNYDIALTTPPYSNKHLWLKRAQELNKPFALLLPVATLGVKRCQIHMTGVDVLFLNKRVDFTGGGAPWFAIAWFTKGLGLPDRMVFV